MAWEIKKLEDVCEVFTDGNWIEKKDQSNDGIRLIQTGNIGKGFYKNKEDKSRFISEKTFERLKCFEVLEGDCLISRLPDPVGRACIIPKINSKLITAVDCTIVRFNPKLIFTNFFNYYSQSKKYLGDIESKTTGATRKRISRKNLGKIEILVPPLPEQKRIVAILDEALKSIKKSKENATQKLKSLNELKQSILQKAFKGELTEGSE